MPLKTEEQTAKRLFAALQHRGVVTLSLGDGDNEPIHALIQEVIEHHSPFGGVSITLRPISEQFAKAVARSSAELIADNRKDS